MAEHDIEIISKIIDMFDCEIVFDVKRFEGERQFKCIKPQWIKEED